jgi:hypothetical protein
MRTVLAQSCSLLDGCINRAQHRAFAWGFVILFVGMVLAALVLAILAMRRERAEQGASTETPKTPETAELPDVYARAKPYAAILKASLQMLVGVIAVSVVGWQALFFSGVDLTTLILNGISIGLAAAAALELAYTLFTPGPDEALDPLMLALSATLLLKLTQLGSPVSMGEALALVLLGLLLAALFATRLMLAERDEKDKLPKIWWLPDREKKQGKES